MHKGRPRPVQLLAHLRQLPSRTVGLRHQLIHARLGLCPLQGRGVHAGLQGFKLISNRQRHKGMYVGMGGGEGGSRWTPIGSGASDQQATVPGLPLCSCMVDRMGHVQRSRQQAPSQCGSGTGRSTTPDPNTPHACVFTAPRVPLPLHASRLR